MNYLIYKDLDPVVSFLAYFHRPYALSLFTKLIFSQLALNCRSSTTFFQPQF